VYNVLETTTCFGPFLGHHQVVPTSLKSTVLRCLFIYCDDEISFVLHMPCLSVGNKVVLIIGSGFWVWGGGEDSHGVILFGVFCFFCSVPSVGVVFLLSTFLSCC
jgi:hypothetical protein